MNAKLISIVAAATLAALACSAPERDFSPEQIEAVVDLEELMYVKATVADPRFKLAKSLKGTTPNAEQWAEFADMGARLQVTSKQAMQFSMGEGFDAYLFKLSEQASALEQAVEVHDAERTLELALDIKKTCAACHKDFR